MTKNLYLWLTGLGLIFPYYFIYRFYAAHDGGTIAAMLGLFSTDMSAAFTADLLLSIMIFWIFVYFESRRIGLKDWWLFVAATAVGLMFALPLFLYFRERQMEQTR